MVKGDNTGLGTSFEDTATHLMLADLIKVKSDKRKSKVGAFISSSLVGQGSTDIDICWYPVNEFKALSEEQKQELSESRNSPEGKAIFQSYRKVETVTFRDREKLPKVKQSNFSGA